MRHARSGQSRSFADPRPIDGRVAAASSATPANSGTVVQRYAPANAARVQPTTRRRKRAEAQ